MGRPAGRGQRYRGSAGLIVKAAQLKALLDQVPDDAEIVMGDQSGFIVPEFEVENHKGLYVLQPHAIDYTDRRAMGDSFEVLE